MKRTIKGRRLGTEARRYPKQELPAPRFVTPRVADFNTLDDLIAHAGRELGATHSSGSEANTKLYFPRGGQYPYEEATVWRKGGYWHAQGPGARAGVARLPSSARPISAQSRRAAEASRPSRASNPQAPIAKRWMRDALAQDVHGEFVDGRTGEVNMTRLAEECAISLGHTEWLDDETNPVWDWSFEVAQEFERAGASHTVRDYVVIDRHDRTIAGPFKSSSDAHQAAGSAGVVKFIPSKPARTAETRSAHRRPSRRR